VESSFEVPQNLKHRITIRLSNSTPRYEPRELKTRTQTAAHTPLFSAALCTIAKKWKPPKCPSLDKWINKMYHVHSMEHY
jgi:hypothetical protein